MTTAAVETPTYDLFIGGEFVPAKSGARFVRKSPATGEPVGDFAKGGKEDTEAAIAAARQAFDSGAWSKAPAKTRAD
jgi:acyl-CoA reductase-like NAD-dependent aldehyde dehydrogenase